MRIAINGFGRIGRCVARAYFERQVNLDQVNLVAINDPSSNDPATSAHLLQFDTVHGQFGHEVGYQEGALLVRGYLETKLFASRDPREIDWGDLGVDVVLDCTGKFRSREQCKPFIEAGAKKVLFSAPAKNEVDATIVYGANHELLTSEMSVVSNASCTTNCLAPVAKVLNDALGIESGMMTSIHAITGSQNLLDGAMPDLRRGRCAVRNVVPTKTGAAKAIGDVLPELAGKLDGIAQRVPVENVSLLDLSVLLNTETSARDINELMHVASRGAMKDVIAVDTRPLVSSDYNHNPHSAIVDATQTKMVGRRFAKVFAWYDNEWGYACRMLDVARAMMEAN